MLADLLMMVGMNPTSRGPGDLGDLITRLRTWLLKQEEREGGEGRPEGPALVSRATAPELTRRRLRALVHAIDGEGFPQWDETVAGTRERRLRAVDRLLGRMAAGPGAGVRRPLCAALARACEGLVRDELAEMGELVLLMSARLRARADFIVLAEATLAPELKEVYRSLGDLMGRLADVPVFLSPPAERGPDRDQDRAAAAAVAGFLALAENLPPGLAAPVEALRRVMVATGRCLDRLVNARSLLALVAGPAAGSLDRLGECVQDLAELTSGVWRRLAQPARSEPIAGRGSLLALDATLVHAARGAEADLASAVTAAVAAVRGDLPAALADVVAAALMRLPALPMEVADSDALVGAPDAEAGLQLPSWLPPSRVMGGFYVMRPIGRGTVGSVFVVCRAEERHEPGADRFALKIPTYDGSVAHTLSEEEFLRLFREEAGALLTLPAHPNLADFVTFDARARPKPVLVMELVEGPTLEKVLERRDLTLPLALGILDGVAAGLETMHNLGIGHLDVKPANVILRAAMGSMESGALPSHASALPPVLVDFGLAGRKVRPGCASPFYGAPEVWVTEGMGPRAEPAPADVYSFCCLAFELLVGRRLFTGDTLPAVVAAHYAHDGDPSGLTALREDAALAAVAEVLSQGLRADPRQRLTIAQLRVQLAQLAPGLSAGRWPLAA